MSTLPSIHNFRRTSPITNHTQLNESVRDMLELAQMEIDDDTCKLNAFIAQSVADAADSIVKSIPEDVWSSKLFQAASAGVVTQLRKLAIRFEREGSAKTTAHFYILVGEMKQIEKVSMAARTIAHAMREYA